MNLPKSWTTVTPLSKTIAMILFIFLPFIGFSAGMRYQQKIEQLAIQNNSHPSSSSPSITPKTASALSTYSEYGISVQIPSEYLPEISEEKTIPSSTLIGFRRKDKLAISFNVLLYPYKKTLQVYHSELLNQYSYYPIQNVQYITFKKERALEYKVAWNKRIVIIRNNMLYQLNLSSPDDQLANQVLSSFEFTTDTSVSPTQSQKVCTQDAMQCPNGKWVGRTGPNCEFICPRE